MGNTPFVERQGFEMQFFDAEGVAVGDGNDRDLFDALLFIEGELVL